MEQPCGHCCARDSAPTYMLGVYHDLGEDSLFSFIFLFFLFVVNFVIHWERVGREVGGGIGMGKTCEPKAFSFQCMTRTHCFTQRFYGKYPAL